MALIALFREPLLHFQIGTYLHDERNKKFAVGLRSASENHSYFIDGPWPVHFLRHGKGNPLCVAIIQDTSLDMGLGGLLKATDNDICAYKDLKITADIN